MSDLETLFPGREVTVKGETIIVLPLFFGQLSAAMKLMVPLFESVKGANILSLAQKGDELSFTIAPDWALRLPMLIVEGGEALTAFVGFCVNRPREWFNTLPTDQGIVLVKAIFAENAEFFRQRILPMLQKGVAAANPPDGVVSSPALSKPDTAEGKSTATP